MAGDSSDSNEESKSKIPSSSCQHVYKGVTFSQIRKTLKRLPNECFDCERERERSSSSSNYKKLSENSKDEDDNLFICLKCGQCRCEDHSKRHSASKTEPHDIALNYVKWIVWCFKCESDVPDNASKDLQQCVSHLHSKNKRGEVDDANSTSAAAEEVAADDTKYRGSFVIQSVPSPPPDQLPTVRGLANLGNTCYFNSVMQCLAQTPFLLPTLEEMTDGDEKFKLAGGEVSFGEDKMTLDPLEGTLKELSYSTLTRSLIQTLRDMQSGSSDTIIPKDLRMKLHEKCPQFAGYAEHDSHELLRQLLETVRNEDLQRYQSAILKELNLVNKGDREVITEEQRRKVKGYGRQAGDLLLRPSQVFRGELVSTLQRLNCKHTTDHVEHFLDLSLPVAADKPVHPRRRANSETNDVISKHQLKKEREMKMKKSKRKQKNSVGSASMPSTEPCDTPTSLNAAEEKMDAEVNEKDAMSNSSGDDSDADNEEEAEPPQRLPFNANDVVESGYSSEKPGNGDSGCGSPNESQTDHSSSPYTGVLDENSVLIRNNLDVTGGRVEPGSILGHVNAGPGYAVTKPDNCSETPPSTPEKPATALLPSTTPIKSDCSDQASPLTPADPDKNEMVLATPSRPDNSPTEDIESNQCTPFPSVQKTRIKPRNLNLSPMDPLPVIALPPPPCGSPVDGLYSGMDNLIVNGPVGDWTSAQSAMRPQCYDTPLDSEQGDCAGALLSAHDSGDADVDTDQPAAASEVDGDPLEEAERTLAPRVTGSSNQCTLITCLNSFTAAELLTNNNKVSCDDCTGPGKKAKTVYSDASKQLLILNPPAILILHLKRFQVQRFSSRKNSESVTFEPILDLAPYCSTKCKNSGLIRKDQTQIRYALYGIVQHSGSMHGGHYVAHVKVRKPLSRDDPRWAYLPPGPSRTGSLADLPDAPPPPPPGKWYYVSDSHVTEVKECRVLSSEAYLLFYERIW